jgi:DNA polymerase elongation subunit (family B)
MKTFYTNVLAYGNSILYRGVRGGEREQVKITDFSPTLFVKSDKPSEWRTIKNESVHPVLPGSIKECKEFIETYSDVSGFDIYGNTYYNYQYISESFKEDVDYDSSLIKMAFIDIETESEKGFASPESPTEKINAITVRIGNKKWVFGIHEFHIDEENVESVVCEDEEHLIEAFLTMWETESPDVLTGWNVEVFDVPYLVTRITLICGEKLAKRLSPWKIIKPSEVVRWGKDTTIYSICGISILNYHILYIQPSFYQARLRLYDLRYTFLGLVRLTFGDRQNF